jgi:hypothetical protein
MLQRRLIVIEAWRLRRAVPCLLILVASLLLNVPAGAAPMMEATAEPSRPASGPVCLATSAAVCDAGFASAPVVPVEIDGAYVIGSGTSLWNRTGLSHVGSIAPIPLPAAGWLVLAGMGALGLMRRRRANARSDSCGAEIEPLGTALRGSALRHAPAAPARPNFLLPPALRRTAHARLRHRWRALAFSPGTGSPVRPCGGAGHRYAATAERAPPRPGGCSPRSGPPADARPTTSTDQPSTPCNHAGLSAAFALPADPRPAAPCGTRAGRPVTTARTGRTRTQSRPRPSAAAVFGRPSRPAGPALAGPRGRRGPAAFLKSNQNGVQS